jgi:hypothetical protein
MDEHCRDSATYSNSINSRYIAPQRLSCATNNTLIPRHSANIIRHQELSLTGPKEEVHLKLLYCSAQHTAHLLEGLGRPQVELLLLLGGHPLPGRAKVAHQVVKVLGCFSVLLFLDQGQELRNGILSCLHRRNAWGNAGGYGLVCI